MLEKKLISFYYDCGAKTLWQRAPPTAMGWTTRAQPYLDLLRAVRLPPAKYDETSEGALPAAGRLTTALSECRIAWGLQLHLWSNYEILYTEPRWSSSSQFGERSQDYHEVDLHWDWGGCSSRNWGYGALTFRILDIRSLQVSSLLGAENIIIVIIVVRKIV